MVGFVFYFAITCGVFAVFGIIGDLFVGGGRRW